MKKVFELIKYGFWGGITTAFNLVVFYLLTRCGVDYIVANVLSYILAVVASYSFNDKLVFKDQSGGSVRRKFAKYIFIRGLSICVESFLLYLSVTLCGQKVFISKLVISGGVILGTYVASKLFVFKSQEEVSG